jgi:SAM-dependent methyltransferase
MRIVSAEYFADHLVEPGSLKPLVADGDVLSAESGARIPIVRGVPVFSDLHPSPQWRDELAQTAEFARLFAAQPPREPSISLWCKPWLADELINPTSRTVCIGGSFVDDVPHVSVGHKFNADLFAHEYTKFPTPVTSAQDTVFVACRAEALPFANASVDYVYTRNALDHFDNPIKAAIEAHRILKPRGLFLLAVYYDSSFMDAHETKIIDRQYVEQIIGPLFETLHQEFVEATATAPVFRDVSTKFVYFVGRKREHANLSVSADALWRYELIGTEFQKALYKREHHDGSGARDCYRNILSVSPVVDSDAFRQLTACLDMLAMSDRDALVTAGAHMRAVGIAANWAPVANLVFGRYGLDIETMEAPEPFQMGSIRVADGFQTWQWLLILAFCVELAGGLDQANALRLQAFQMSGEALDWVRRSGLI